MTSGEPLVDPVVVRAAGTVLWRPGPAGCVRIAVVHRARQRDWSLPKGKFQRGETAGACAVRETAEETGYRPVLGRPLGAVNYPIAQPRAGRKVVDYFVGRATDGEFAPNDEVDDLRWVSPDSADGLLSYATDRATLAAFTALPADTATVLLVRHAKAGPRAGWAGPDRDRPLSPTGEQQAAALRELLPLFGPTRVHAASRARCVQTVAAVAADLGVPVVDEPLLTEESYVADPVVATRRLATLAQRDGVPVICSQGGAIPNLIGALARRSGLVLDRIPCKKGSTWVLSFGRTAPLRLLAAAYLPTALPWPEFTAPIPAPAPPSSP